MDREEDSENVDEIDGGGKEKYRESKGKESSRRTEWIISNEKDRKHEVDRESYEYSKSRLIEFTQTHKVVGHSHEYCPKKKKIYIKVCDSERIRE